MKRKNVKKLGLAIAAAMIIGTSTMPAMAAVSYDLNPTSALQAVQENLQAGNKQQAMAIIKRLRAMGVKQITVDGAVISIDELEQIVADGSSDAIAVLVAYVAAAQTGNAGFGIDRQVAFTSASSRDTFPVSSAG